MFDLKLTLSTLFLLTVTLLTATLSAKKSYPNCDSIRPLIDWFGDLDCRKVPSAESLTFLPEENAVMFKIGKDVPMISTSWKNEFRDNLRPPIESEYNYHLETKFYKDGVPKRDKSIVVIQWHDRKDGFDRLTPEQQERAQRSRPPLTLRVIDHKLVVILWNDEIFDAKGGVGNGKILYTQDIDFGKWYNFDFDIKWSAQDSGQFKFYIDGKMVVNYKGPIGYELDIVGSYFKFGFYTVHPFEDFGSMKIAHRNYSRTRLK